MVRPPERGPPMLAGAVKGLLLAGEPSFDEVSSSSSSESESAATALPACMALHSLKTTCFGRKDHVSRVGHGKFSQYHGQS